MTPDKSACVRKLVTQTPAVVGPGSYDVYEPSKPPRDLGECLIQCRGGVSVDFTDSRLKPKMNEGPGPETYSLPDNLFRSSRPRLRVHPGTWRGPAGKLWLGNPPRSIMANGVSVPSKLDENGYDIKRGILVKNPRNECAAINFYDIPRGDANFTTLRYKGNFWSMMTGRDENRIEESPGPCAYELDRSTDPAKRRDETFRSMKRAAPRQSRYLDDLWRRKLLEDQPAPNSYSPPKGPFDKDCTCDCDKYVVEPPAFGRSAKRFEGKTSDHIPGPGSYNPVDEKNDSCSKLFAPFGACASRFKRQTENSAPGPGSYDLTKDYLAKRFFTICRHSYARPRVLLRCKSSSGSIRHGDAAGESRITPDPWANKSRVHHAVFKSTTARFKDARPRITCATGTSDRWFHKSLFETRDDWSGLKHFNYLTLPVNLTNLINWLMH